MKLFPQENLNYIISPYKEQNLKPFNDNFYQNNFNMGSPDNNLPYFSPMKGK